MSRCASKKVLDELCDRCKMWVVFLHIDSPDSFQVGIRFYNKLPLNVFDFSFNKFKAFVKLKLINKAYYINKTLLKRKYSLEIIVYCSFFIIYLSTSSLYFL